MTFFSPTLLYQKTEYEQTWHYSFVTIIRNYKGRVRVSNYMFQKLVLTELGSSVLRFRENWYQMKQNLGHFSSWCCYCVLPLHTVWSVSAKLHLCPGNPVCLCSCGHLYTAHISFSLSAVVLWSSQAGLGVHGDSRERLTQRLSLNQTFLGLWLHSSLVFLSDLM